MAVAEIPIPNPNSKICPELWQTNSALASINGFSHECITVSEYSDHQLCLRNNSNDQNQEWEFYLLETIGSNYDEFLLLLLLLLFAIVFILNWQ